MTVRKTGETYSVVWVVGGTRYIGTGIGNKDFIAVSYRSGNNTGLVTAHVVVRSGLSNSRL